MFHRPRDEEPASEKEAATTNTRARENVTPPVARMAAEKASTPMTHSNQQKEQRAMTPTQADEKHEHGHDQRHAEIPANMQRMQTLPGSARIPGSYASSYPGYSGGSNNSAASHSTATQPETSGLGRKLIVGEGINLSGEIEACDHLIVEGKVEATLKGASVLDIAESGVFYGTVEIEEATIAGRFEGDLTVAGRLTIKSTGSITGAIAYRELAVEAGATVDGKIGPIRDRSESRKTESKGKAAAEAPVRRREPSVHQEDDGLPFMEKTAAAAE